ncbi:MAG: ArsR/SmtB family transcription factor [Candidatus Dormibacteraceae bacterium]
MRALAHPARLAILDALVGGDELTATECAQLTGLTPSATAYHLRLLQRFDLLEPAVPRQDGRERPWRSTGRHRRTALDTSTPSGAATAATLLATVFDRGRAIAVEAAKVEQRQPAEWRDVSALSSGDFWLTADEARAVMERLDAVLEPYRGRRVTDHPAGSRRVLVLRMVAPHGRPPSPGTD